MVKIISQIFSRRMLCVLFLGLSSGLPLLLIGSTLKAWMKEKGIDLGSIGLIGMVGLPYSLKFVWAPVLDRISLPFLDRRRGWILVFQIILSILLVVLANIDPASSYWTVAFVCFWIAFFSASQDIVIDAYRREVLEDSELALGSSFAVNGYRIGMLLSGAFALSIAEIIEWKFVYLIMAAIMLSCIVITFVSPKVETVAGAPKTLKEAVIYPFIEFFKRSGAVYILIFILLYKIGDQLASDMLIPFYMDSGFSKLEIGAISKLYGFWATILGAFIGGVILLRIKLHTGLLCFGVLQMLSTFCFGLLCFFPNLWVLTGVVSFENLTSGMGTSAYTAFMAKLCNKKFTATQYALLSSFMGIPRVVFGSTSGYMAEYMGWFNYFMFCGGIAIFGLMMLVFKKWQD